jgi:hypothetical protein
MTRYLISVFLIILTFNSISQRNVKDSTISTPWIGVHYGICDTEGDLAKRHGYFNQIGLFFGYKTKRNWVYGLDGSYLFGRDVRVSGLFDHLVDSKGNITDQNGDIAIVLVYSRGLSVDANIGKIIPVLSPNENSGIYLNFGVGYLAHKIRVETQDQVIPTLELDYRKGYDRLSTGINTQQLLGYAFMSNQGFVNFYAGFYCQQGFTYNRRTVFFDQPETPVSTDYMLDIQYGFRFSWLIPIYKRQPKDFYYN